MSVVVAVKKENAVCIAADTQTTRGTTKIFARHLQDHEKIHQIGSSYIGLVGWQAITQIVEHIIHTQPKSFDFTSRIAAFESMLALHNLLKEKYFIMTQEGNEQPVESNQISALIINQHGIFELDSYREVHEITHFWAIGSGSKFALGAMTALYDKAFTATEIAAEGVKAAAEYDRSCGLPLTSKTIQLDR